MCADYATATMPDGINTCSRSYPDWLLVCAARPGEADAPAEWRFCSDGCEAMPYGHHDRCL